MTDYTSLIRSEIPEHETKLPKSKKIVKYRPFLVKEEKVLLVAKQNGKKEDQLRAIENVILSCSSLTKIDNLPLVDVEHLFLELRKNSIGEVVDLNFKCPETGENIKVSLNLDDIKPTSKTNKKNIKLSTQKNFEFRDYTFGDFKRSFSTLNSKFDEIVFLLSKIETPSQVIDCKSLTKKQKSDIIDNLLPVEYKKLISENNKTARYEHNLKYTTKSGEQKSLLVRGLFDFFCFPSAI